MGKPRDLVGLKFGKVSPIKIVGVHQNRANLWECVCECGVIFATTTTCLTNGKTKSCGCMQKEKARSNIRLAHKSSITHGATLGGKKSSEYAIWQSMKNRCYSPNNVGFHRYGGRGIRVCERWISSFQNFIDDMGPRPSLNFTLDRIDNDGNYEPDNCRWATAGEQAAHTARNRVVVINGEELHLSEAIRKFSSVASGTVSARISHGWDIEDAILFPKTRNYLERKSMSS